MNPAFRSTIVFAPGSVLNSIFSPDGTRLVTSSSDGTTKVWDVSLASGQKEQPLTLYASSPILGAVFSPDGKRLVTGAANGTVRVWALPLEDIVAIAKSRVTRALTIDECQKFLHVEQCPADPRLGTNTLPLNKP